MKKFLSLFVLLVAIVTGAQAADYTAPATKQYGDITFLDVSGTDANVTVSTNEYLTYGAYYIAQTKKITTWYNSSDGSPAGNKENGVIGDFSSQGFIKVTVTTQDDTNGDGGLKSHNTRIRFYYVTGATSVAGLVKDNSTSKYTQLLIQEVAEDGTLGTATTIDGNKSTSQYVIDGGTLDPTKYYKVSFSSNAGSNCVVYQVRFGKPATKNVTSKVLTGININGEAWDIAGLSENAATISTAYNGLPEVEFVYTINYDDETADENQTETVTASQDGENYVAASTVLTSNVTLTFDNVTIAKQDAGLAYATASVTKKVKGATLTNALTNPNGVTVTYSISDNGTGSTINASTGAVVVGGTAGSETITATFEGDALYNAGNATYTLVVAEGSAQSTVSEATTWTWDNITPKSQIDYDPKPTFVLADEDALDFSSFGDATAIKLLDAQRSMYKGKAWCAQAGGFTIEVAKAGTINVSFSGTNPNDRAVYVNDVKVADYNSTDKAETGDVAVEAGTVTFLFKEGDGGTLGRIYSITYTPFESQNITVGTSGFATAGLPFATTVPEGVTAYAVESVSGTTVTVSSAIAAGTTIPGNKGYIIVAAPETYTFTEVASAEYDGTNKLEATGKTAKTATEEAPIYVLTANETTQKVSFKKATSGSLGAYKAYLPGDVASAQSLTISFADDVATAINGIEEAEAQAAPVKVITANGIQIGKYNVAGQQVK